MKNWKTLKKELLKDPEVAAEYAKLKPRYQLISQLIEARKGYYSRVACSKSGN